MCVTKYMPFGRRSVRANDNGDGKPNMDEGLQTLKAAKA